MRWVFGIVAAVDLRSPADLRHICLWLSSIYACMTETDHWSFRSPCTWCSSRWTSGWSGCIRSMFLTGMAEIQTFQRSFFNMSKGCDDVIMAGCFARRTAKGVSRSWWWRHVGLHFDAFCISCDMLLFCFIQRPKDRVHPFRKYEKVLSRRTWNLQRA